MIVSLSGYETKLNSYLANGLPNSEKCAPLVVEIDKSIELIKSKMPPGLAACSSRVLQCLPWDIIGAALQVH